MDANFLVCAPAAHYTALMILLLFITHILCFTLSGPHYRAFKTLLRFSACIRVYLRTICFLLL